MDFFEKTRAVRLKSHLDKYLVADDDQETTRQSRRSGDSRRARWLVELVDGNSTFIRFKGCHGRYLTASNDPFLLGMTGNKVIQTVTDYQNMNNNGDDWTIEWEPIKDGFQMKFRTRGGTYLRANGGTPPWRNSLTHDAFQDGAATHNSILWDAEAVEIPEDETLNDYLSIISSFSSVSNEIAGLELGSPISVHSGSNIPRLSTQKFSIIPKDPVRLSLAPSAKFEFSSEATQRKD